MSDDPNRLRPGRDRSRWQRLPSWARWTIGVFAGVLVLAAIFGEEEPDTERRSTQAAVRSAPAATTTPASGARVSSTRQIVLTSATNGDAQGLMTVSIDTDGRATFTIEADRVPESRAGEAYGVWLVGGGKPVRLGFAPSVGADGKFAVSGPREGAAPTFTDDFARAGQVVISRETSQNASRPGRIVLAGSTSADDALPAAPEPIQPEEDGTAEEEAVEAQQEFFFAMDDLAIHLDTAIGDYLEGDPGAFARIKRFRAQIIRRANRYIEAGGPSGIGPSLLISAAATAREAAIDENLPRLVDARQDITEARKKLAEEAVE